jgi:hypothetical protein
MNLIQDLWRFNFIAKQVLVKADIILDKES